ncbi:helix-turn-helix transcriptional regulator, partial [Gottfriedia acidiceleris]
MIEGEVIKFYRTKAGLTQEELGKGICSSKHVGKIERGSTSYSSEIITLFSERLQIDIRKEIANFENLENKLLNWHTAIIKLRMKEVDSYKKELEKTPFINSPKYDALYQLLLARYYLLKNDYKNTYT